WEQKLLAKEKELGQAEVELKTLEDQLKERYENATMIEKRAGDDRRHVEAKERELLTREKMISDKESGLEKASTESERLRAAVKGLELETKAREGRAAAATPGIKDMEQDAALARWQDDLRKKEEDLQRRQYQLTKEMEAKEQSLRAQVQAGVTDGMEAVTIEE